MKLLLVVMPAREGNRPETRLNVQLGPRARGDGVVE